jgi:hypothetical protein
LPELVGNLFCGHGSLGIVIGHAQSVADPSESFRDTAFVAQNGVRNMSRWERGEAVSDGVHESLIQGRSVKVNTRYWT